MAIVTLVLWMLTVAAGVTLLKAGGAARRTQASQQPDLELAAKTPAEVGASRSQAIPLTPEGRPPPVPHARVIVQPGEHPLLEFAHPTLAVSGTAVWFMFTFIHYRPLAWVALGILVVALSLGLGWLVRNKQAARHRAEGAWPFPARLVALHGFAAGLSITLTVLTALIASRG